MKRTAFLLISLLAVASFHTVSSYATSNKDAETCHHGVDGDRGRVAAMPDGAKKTEAYGDVKAASTAEMAGSYTDCLSDLKAAEALMQ